MNHSIERELTLRQARALHYAEQGLPEDGGLSARVWTLIKLGPWPLELPNFAWRKRALPCHDLHHLLTGYPCSVDGEYQTAAWEFAAGRFPSLGSSLFCLPLVGIGAVVTPKATFVAFVRGRRSTTLYRTGLTEDLLDSSLAELRASLLPMGRSRASLRDIASYSGLVLLALALLLGPVVMLIWALSFS